jgi:hypothetical protein
MTERKNKVSTGYDGGLSVKRRGQKKKSNIRLSSGPSKEVGTGLILSHPKKEEERGPGLTLCLCGRERGRKNLLIRRSELAANAGPLE